MAKDTVIKYLLEEQTEYGVKELYYFELPKPMKLDEISERIYRELEEAGVSPKFYEQSNLVPLWGKNYYLEEDDYFLRQDDRINYINEKPYLSNVLYKQRHEAADLTTKVSVSVQKALGL